MIRMARHEGVGGNAEETKQGTYMQAPPGAQGRRDRAEDVGPNSVRLEHLLGRLWHMDVGQYLLFQATEMET